MEEEKKWYVVNTYSGHEDKVKEKLDMRINSMEMQENIFRVIVPERKEVQIKDGKKTEKMKKLFPGYVLVEMIMSDESWYIVRNTPGVTGFLGSSGKGAKPVPLYDEEVQRIFKEIGYKGDNVVVNFEVGDKVITASGRARKVVNKFINDYSGEIYKIEGENIGATPTHKFYTFNTITHAKEFVEISNIDDRFMSFINAEGKTLEKQIDIDEYTGKVYNIEVEDEHTYAVGNSILGVSNCSTNLQCFPADTLVTTSRGLIKISELLPTDYVLTHTGEYEKINSFFEKEYNGDMIKINDILVTPDHPFFVINKEDESLITEENYKNYGYWLEAKYITKNHVLISLE